MNSLEILYLPHQGAKNLIKTVFPDVNSSKFSGVNSVTAAVALATRANSRPHVKVFMVSLSFVCLLVGWFLVYGAAGVAGDRLSSGCSEVDLVVVDPRAWQQATKTRDNTDPC